jgi:hypothetical protein
MRSFSWLCREQLEFPDRRTFSSFENSQSHETRSDRFELQLDAPTDLATAGKRLPVPSVLPLELEGAHAVIFLADERSADGGCFTEVYLQPGLVDAVVRRPATPLAWSSALSGPCASTLR